MSYKNFRTNYPLASLITELVQIDHGQYIVRCLVQENGITLCSGLAADQSVEIAENRAIERALALLNIDNSEDENISKAVHDFLKNSKIPTFEYTDYKRLKKELSLSQEKSKLIKNYQESSGVNSVNINDLNLKEVPQHTTEEISSKLPEGIIASANVDSVHVTPPVEILKQETEKSVEEKEVQPTESSTLACESLDFSSIIAKTNLELKRLDWSTQQGKDHLMQTYGKRSRQLLSDKELLDFLKYLEGQPTPNGLF